jgi:hypothetical protein
MRSLSYGRRLGFGVGLAMIVACSTGRAPASRSPLAPTTCAGQPYVDVHNHLSAPIEVYSSVGGVVRYLSSVPPGIHRVPLSGQVGHIYAVSNGRRVSMTHGINTVTFTRGCERA